MDENLGVKSTPCKSPLYAGHRCHVKERPDVRYCPGSCISVWNIKQNGLTDCFTYYDITTYCYTIFRCARDRCKKSTFYNF